MNQQNEFINQQVPGDDIQVTRDYVLEKKDELNALLEYCASRVTHSNGIPAILVIDDFMSKEKEVLSPAKSDEGLGKFYADLSLALAIVVEDRGGDRHDPPYPSICPAMSAIAEERFTDGPFNQWKDGPGGCRGWIDTGGKA